MIKCECRLTTHHWSPLASFRTLIRNTLKGEGGGLDNNPCTPVVFDISFGKAQPITGRILMTRCHHPQELSSIVFDILPQLYLAHD